MWTSEYREITYMHSSLFANICSTVLKFKLLTSLCVLSGNPDAWNYQGENASSMQKEVLVEITMANAVVHDCMHSGFVFLVLNHCFYLFCIAWYSGTVEHKRCDFWLPHSSSNACVAATAAISCTGKDTGTGGNQWLREKHHCLPDRTFLWSSSRLDQLG